MKEEAQYRAIQCISTLASDYELHVQESFDGFDDEELWEETMKEVGKRMLKKEKEIFKLIFPKGMPNKLINKSSHLYT